MENAAEDAASIAEVIVYCMMKMGYVNNGIL